MLFVGLLITLNISRWIAVGFVAFELILSFLWSFKISSKVK